jgi:hypothetical protein
MALSYAATSSTPSCLKGNDFKLQYSFMLKPRNAAFAKSLFLIWSYRNGACTLPVFLALAWKETFCSYSAHEEAKKYAIEVEDTSSNNCDINLIFCIQVVIVAIMKRDISIFPCIVEYLWDH